MARSTVCVRAALRKLSARYQPHLPTCDADPNHAGAHSLLGGYGSQKLQEKVSTAPEVWPGCHSSVKSEIWASDAARSSRAFPSRKLLAGPGPLLLHRSFSIWGGGKEKDAVENSSGTEPLETHDGISAVRAEEGTAADRELGGGVYDKLMDSIEAVQEKFNVVVPQVEETLEKYPILSEIAVPVGVFTGAWIILPRVLRRLHRYVGHGTAAFYKGLSDVRHVQTPYEQSVWKAMELPSRLFATILTILQVGALVAPNAMAAQYLTQFWAGGGIMCIVLFLHNWKSNVVNRLLTTKPLTVAERERYLTIDKFSSLGLVFIGALGLAEAYGLKIQSLLTVGGIGGVATAFAARDILGNMLTGVALSFTKPFSVGDQIKAGHVEGKVEEVGLHSTKLLNTEKNPIIVPNSFFQSQVIVNKSRAPWRALFVKIPVRLQDYQKVPIFTLEILEMLNHHPQVHFGEDKPRCSIAQFTPSSIEITVSCNVKSMSKDEFLQVQQGILLEAAEIITRSGAVLGGDP